MFVNKVVGSQKLHKLKLANFLLIDFTMPIRNPFCKYRHRLNPQPTKKDYKKIYIVTRYRNIGVNAISNTDEYVVDASITIPGILFYLKQKKM